MPDTDPSNTIDSASPIELAEALTTLRKQLQQAQKESADEDLRFKIADLEVEMQVTLGKQRGVSGGAKFWVLNAQGKHDSSSQVVQKIKLKLIPTVDGESDVLISDTVTRSDD